MSTNMITSLPKDFLTMTARDAYAEQCVSDSTAIATQYIGVKEVRHSNNSSEIKLFKGGKSNSQPWCAYFTNYVCTHGLNDSNLFDIKNIGSSQAIKKAANEAGLLKTEKDYCPQQGDLIVWQNKKNSSKGHIGIVTKVYEDGSFDTVQGNFEDQVKEVHYNSKEEAQHPNKGEYGGTELVGFVDMHSYYKNKFDANA